MESPILYLQILCFYLGQIYIPHTLKRVREGKMNRSSEGRKTMFLLEMEAPVFKFMLLFPPSISTVHLVGRVTNSRKVAHWKIIGPARSGRTLEQNVKKQKKWSQ